ncbi:hypothetical protein QBC40DRAFT_2556 [Triangularia verruculosa]|uniref:RING-type E3 ubiquitin transferase n=1 Tax=Triangularia verruculosa TaxID=2587418 RepID=A0AAN7AWN5_9PEZI|nr:hypothetical protein QBC40DRAFT_2556 [Triangularia verruculosa]
MASFGMGPRRHLDADAGREVVYCHSCQNEWYSDEPPPRLEPQCPRCHSEIVEIVEPGASDPRIEAGGGLNPMGGLGSYFRHNAAGDDSDPEEDDIENHFPGPARSPFGRNLFPPTPGTPGGDDGRAGQNEVVNRFFELIFHDLGGGRVVRESQGGHDHEHNHSPGAAPSPSPPRHVHSATFTFVSGPGARSDQPPPIGPLFGPYARSPPRHHHHHHSRPHRTVTFVTGGSVANNDPINRILAQVMGIPVAGMAGPPDPNQPRNRAAGAGPPPMGGGVFGLQQLLATILNPAAAVHGDAVFTQEALDRIITQLMENSPQTNAAPPASESAIESLEKKKVDKELLGPEGKAECTICIDEFKLGDEVTVLPCSHWYHGECVVLWLKEHNTCPICRKPIESREDNRGGGNNSGQQPPGADQAASSSSQAQQSQQSSNEPPRMSGFPNPWASSSRPDEAASGSSSSFQSPLFFSTTARVRTPQEQQDRLDRIRNLSGHQRRSSASPPGAWPDDDNTDSRSSRQRSPSRPRDDNFGERGYNNGGIGNHSENSRRSYLSSFMSSARDQQSQRQQQREGSSSSNNDNSNHNNSGNGSSGSGNSIVGWIRDRLNGDRNNGNGNGRR